MEADETVNVVRHERSGDRKVPCVGYHDCYSIVKVGKSNSWALKSKGEAPCS